MKKLSKEQILMLHTQLIQQTGGSDGVRDYNLLDSALETPFQSFGGDELYPTIQAKAARLGYGLIKNHCMIDGNKRIGSFVINKILIENGKGIFKVPVELDGTFKQMLVSYYESDNSDELASWIYDNCLDGVNKIENR